MPPDGVASPVVLSVTVQLETRTTVPACALMMPVLALLATRQLSMFNSPELDARKPYALLPQASQSRAETLPPLPDANTPMAFPSSRTWYSETWVTVPVDTATPSLHPRMVVSFTKS